MILRRTILISLIGIVGWGGSVSMLLAKKPAKRFQSVTIQEVLEVNGPFWGKGDFILLGDTLLIEESLDEWIEVVPSFNWNSIDSSLQLGIASQEWQYGMLSFSWGTDALASGESSLAFGRQVESIGNGAMSLGSLSVAEGEESMALGLNSFAAGDRSIALNGGLAVAEQSVAIGKEALAASYNSLAIGQFNLGLASVIDDDSDLDSRNVWLLEDAVFEVGIGSSAEAPANALTILKDGRVGIGTSEPSGKVHIVGDLIVDGAVRIPPQGDIPMMEE